MTTPQHHFRRVFINKKKKCKVCKQNIDPSTTVFSCVNAKCKFVRIHKTCLPSIEHTACQKGARPIAPQSTVVPSSPATQKATQDPLLQAKTGIRHKEKKEKQKWNEALTDAAAFLDQLQGKTEPNGKEAEQAPKKNEVSSETAVAMLENTAIVSWSIQEALQFAEARAMQTQQQLLKIIAKRNEVRAKKNELWVKLISQMKQQRELLHQDATAEEELFKQMNLLVKQLQVCSTPFHKSIIEKVILGELYYSVNPPKASDEDVKNTPNFARANILRRSICTDNREGLTQEQIESIKQFSKSSLAILDSMKVSLQAFWAFDDNHEIWEQGKNMEEGNDTIKRLEALSDALTKEGAAYQQTTQLRQSVATKLTECVKVLTNYPHEEAGDQIRNQFFTTDGKLHDSVEETRQELDANAKEVLAISGKELNQHIKTQTEEYVKSGMVELFEEGASDFAKVHEIKAISVDALIELVTSAFCPEYSYFQQVFFITFRYYMSSVTLLEKLIMRYCVSPPLSKPENELADYRGKVQQPIRFRVLVVLKYWIEHFFLDFDSESMSALLEGFLRNTATLTGNIDWSKKLLQILKLQKDKAKAQQANDGKEKRVRAATRLQFANNPKLMLQKDSEKKALIGSAKIKSIETHENLNVLDYPAKEFAIQLTLIEHKFLCEIKWTELIFQRWNKKDKQTLAGGVVRVTEHFNNMGKWVVWSVVSEPSIEGRAALIKRFICIALHLYSLNNYNGAIEILAGLDNTPVARLRLTWKEVGWDLFVVKQKLRLLLQNNYGYYREDLKTANLPSIPYIGMFLKDLTFLEDGNKNFKGDKVNFFKFHKITETIKTLLKYQDVGYLQPNNVELHEKILIISHASTMDDMNKAYQCSVSIESLNACKNEEKFNYNAEDPPAKSLSRLQALRSHLLLQENADAAPLRKDVPIQSVASDAGSKEVYRATRNVQEFYCEVITCMKNEATGVTLKTRKYMFKTYEKAFSGEEAVTWMLENLEIGSREEAVELGQQLLLCKKFKHVNDSQGFKDKAQFYQFT